MNAKVAAALAALPDTRHEDWRYTDLGPLKARAWTDAVVETTLLDLDGSAPVTKVVRLGDRAEVLADE